MNLEEKILHDEERDLRKARRENDVRIQDLEALAAQGTNVEKEITELQDRDKEIDRQLAIFDTQHQEVEKFNVLAGKGKNDTQKQA